MAVRSIAQASVDREDSCTPPAWTIASDEFARMWGAPAVQTIGEDTKTIHHAMAGEIAFECSSLSVDGRPDLKLMIYNPEDDAGQDKLRRLYGHRARRARSRQATGQPLFPARPKPGVPCA